MDDRARPSVIHSSCHLVSLLPSLLAADLAHNQRQEDLVGRGFAWIFAEVGIRHLADQRKIRKVIGDHGDQLVGCVYAAPSAGQHRHPGIAVPEGQVQLRRVGDARRSQLCIRIGHLQRIEGLANCVIDCPFNVVAVPRKP